MQRSGSFKVSWIWAMPFTLTVIGCAPEKFAMSSDQAVRRAASERSSRRARARDPLRGTLWTSRGVTHRFAPV